VAKGAPGGLRGGLPVLAVADGSRAVVAIVVVFPALTVLVSPDHLKRIIATVEAAPAPADESSR
jgi:hypothetical protein